MTYIAKCKENFKAGIHNAVLVSLAPFLPAMESHNSEKKYTFRDYSAFAYMSLFALITFPIGATMALVQLSLFPFKLIVAKVRDLFSKFDVKVMPFNEAVVGANESFDKEELKNKNVSKNDFNIKLNVRYESLFPVKDAPNKPISKNYTEKEEEIKGLNKRP